MQETNSKDNYDAQTLILNDSNGNELFCYLEQLVSVEGQEYALLTPVDTPVSLFKINEKDEPELIEKIDKNCLLYTSPSPRDMRRSRMPSSA